MRAVNRSLGADEDLGEHFKDRDGWKHVVNEGRTAGWLLGMQEVILSQMSAPGLSIKLHRLSAYPFGLAFAAVTPPAKFKDMMMLLAHMLRKLSGAGNITCLGSSFLPPQFCDGSFACHEKIVKKN